jgi:hypothetical protein
MSVARIGSDSRSIARQIQKIDASCEPFGSAMAGGIGREPAEAEGKGNLQSSVMGRSS